MPTSPATKRQRSTSSQLLSPKVLWLVGGLVAVLVLVGGGLVAVAYASVGQKIVGGVTVAGQSVGGRDVLSAAHVLEQRWERFRGRAFQFSGGGRTMSILVTADTSADDEMVLGLVDFDPVAAASKALTFGRRGNWWQQVRERTSGFLGRRHELATVTTADDELLQTLIDRYGDLEHPAKHTTITYDGSGLVRIEEGISGTTFDYRAAASAAIRGARRLDAASITLSTVVVPPPVLNSSKLATIIQTDLPEFLARAPFILTWKGKTWTVTKTQAAGLMGFTGTTAAPRLSFDVVKTTAFLTTLAQDVDAPAQNSKFTIVDGRAEEFQPGRVGMTLDVAASIAAVQSALIDSGLSTVALTVTEEQPQSASTSATELGITELVAEATTNFRGSPTNRRFNLRYGARLLNGLLIQPGDEFSLVKALGKIDGAHGWKPELVIKGSDITPEYGGGLCQVGTTMFRVALNAGLPILERHNHSLRIRYYEPPIGLDATIYEPKPDLRFRNDYSHPLLLQTNVDGDNITFQFYGTKDGRTVDLPTPKVYNKTGIPATKNIEVDDLKPGQKECQAPGHPGADATATYTVTKADGTKVTQTFQSHYRALGVICRVGKKAAPKSTTNTNSSTPDTNTAGGTNTNIGG